MGRSALAVVAVVMLSAFAVGCRESGSPTGERRVQLEYSFSVPQVVGEAVIAWLPMPLGNVWQSLDGYEVTEGVSFEEVTDEKYGNRFLRFRLSRSPGAGTPDRVSVKFKVSRRPVAGPDLNGEKGSPSTPENSLAAESLVPAGGAVANEAVKVTAGLTDAPGRARRIYDHIVDSVAYDKSVAGWGRGDAVRACDVRTGNCTDFHSLFIGEARAVGIPSRFVIGFPLPPRGEASAVAGYHCWAEFHVSGRGWSPVDASEARKHPERREDLFGRLDADRVSFTVGRDIVLPGSTSGPRNYIVYPHVEVDGRVHEKIVWKVTARDL